MIVCMKTEIASVNPDKNEDLKTEESEQSSALGSIGLKPKVVH